MMESMEKMKELMEISIFEVFEKMFFIFLEPSDLVSPIYDVESSIRFHGGAEGEVVLFFSDRILREMVQNMLGLKEHELTESDIEDCSKEAVNMICGNFLAKLNDRTDTFILTIPEFHRPLKYRSSEEHIVNRMDFLSDTGKIGALLQVFD